MNCFLSELAFVWNRNRYQTAKFTLKIIKEKPSRKFIQRAKHEETQKNAKHSLCVF
jgi:hypothetical protein